MNNEFEGMWIGISGSSLLGTTLTFVWRDWRTCQDSQFRGRDSNLGHQEYEAGVLAGCRQSVWWAGKPRGTHVALTWLRLCTRLLDQALTQDFPPSVMGAGIDRGLGLSPRKRSDAERRNTLGLGTGIRLSSSLLLCLEATFSPMTPPSIMSVTWIGTNIQDVGTVRHAPYGVEQADLSQNWCFFDVLFRRPRHERITLKWILRKQWRGLNFIRLAQDADQWKVLVNTVITFQVS